MQKKNGAKTISNKGGTVLEKTKSKTTKQKQQNQETNIENFTGKGVKIGSNKQEPMNWICQLCGFINPKCNNICKMCSYDPHQQQQQQQ